MYVTRQPWLILGGWWRYRFRPPVPKLDAEVIGERVRSAVKAIGDPTAEQNFKKPPARFSEATLVKALEKQGIAIHTGATVAGLVHGADEVTATIAQGDDRTEAAFDRVILAVGIVGNVEDLGLEGTAVAVDRGHIVTDEFCATGEPGVFAIGDVAGPPWRAHKATHEGVLGAERIAGVAGVHPLDRTKIPGCTYCRPQIASVGFTETAAKEAGYEVRTGHFPFVGNGKAVALGEREGMVKTVFDAGTGELLGAHMIGAEVTELIQGYVIARNLETTEAELMHAVFPHPTLSEMMHESVLDAYDRVIHF